MNDGAVNLDTLSSFKSLFAAHCSENLGVDVSDHMSRLFLFVVVVVVEKSHTA